MNPTVLPHTHPAPMARPALQRVLLIEPENGYYTGFQGLVRSEPLGLEYIASAITPLVQDVRIHDDRVDPNGWKRKITTFPPDLIGIRCNYTADVPIVRQLARTFREIIGAGIPIIVGGHHISLRPEDLFIPPVTAIAIGPGEKTFQDIVTAWGSHHSLENVQNIWYQDKDGTFVSNVPHRGVSPRFTYNSPVMNDRPRPRRDLVSEYRHGYYFLYYPQPYSLETARGCRYRCSFCSVWNFHSGEYDVESSSRTVAEIATIGGSYINLVDDLAFSDISAARETAEELIRLGIKKRYWAQIRSDNVWPKDEAKRKEHLETFELLAQAGLDMVLIGLESFDPKELKRVNKGSTVAQNIEAIRFLRSVGVKIWGAQIVFPSWTVEDFDKAIEINQSLGIECPQFTILTPLPGTPDYESAKKSGELLTEDPAKYDFFHWVIPTRLRPEELYSQISRLYSQTSSFAKRLDGRPVNWELAKRQVRSIKEDILAGRSTEAAVREFTERFRNLQDAANHLAHLATSGLFGDVPEVSIA